jgi:hypothetical protein
MIPILMILFSLGGTTYGMAEETLAFYAILITVILVAGYDVIIGVAIILIGATIVIGIIARLGEKKLTGSLVDARDLLGVAAVYRNFGTDTAAALQALTVAEARVLDMPTGSMGPKLAAACDFAETGGSVALAGFPMPLPYLRERRALGCLLMCRT